jgi:hypothetical protein
MIINEIMLYLLIALTAALLLRGVLRHQDILRFPFLAAAVMAGWFIPQAIGLSENELLPEGGFALTMLVAILGLGGTVLGGREVQGGPRATLQEYDVPRLLVVSLVLSVIGIGAEYLILNTHTDDNTIASGQATGIVTIYFFFMQCQYYGLMIALLALLRSFSWSFLSVVTIDIMMILGIIFYGGRRGPATELGLILGSAFWFQRRLLPPRIMVAAVLIVASLLVNSIGDYRRLATKTNVNEHRLPTISEIMELDLFGHMDDEIDSGSHEITNAVGSHEVTNAIYDIAATANNTNFDFGLVYWNYLVFRYIPAQIVGRDIKDALTVGNWDNAWEVFQYKPHVGTSHTGFSDSFCAFWLLGPLVFVMIAAILQRWWRDAMLGDFRAKVLYGVTISIAAESISHGTCWFFAYLPELFLLVLPLLYWARKQPVRPARRDPRQIRENYQVWPRTRSASL